MHLLCFQDPTLTCGLERCVQVPVKSTQTSTTAWTWWRRCCFRNQPRIQSPEWFETTRIWDVFNPGVNFIIKCQLSLHLRLPKKNPQHFLSGIKCRQSRGSQPHPQSLTVQKKKKTLTICQLFPNRWWASPSLNIHLVRQSPHSLWPPFTSCFGRLYNSYMNMWLFYSWVMILLFILQLINVLFICQPHNHVSCLLQKVEDTVEKLETELAALLDAIDAPEWRPLLDNTGNTAVDILEDPGPALN